MIGLNAAYPSLIHFPPDILEQINLLDKELDENIEPEKLYLENKIIDFSDSKINKIWDILLQSIIEYRKFEINKKLKIANAAVSSNEQELNNAKNEYEDWKTKNHNPLEELAEKHLKFFLEKFNLKINYGFKNLQSLKAINFEPLLQNIDIKPEKLSTGTKQIILKTLPFYAMQDEENDIASPTNSIILMDEPENSLYPDVQRVIIEHFERITENCQFFYATHSPIIASNFEPCEKFILSFDKNGYIKVENGIAPEGTHSNEILTLDYKTQLLPETGEKAWKRFVELNRLIKFETEKEKLKELKNEFNKIDKIYKFSH